jgi:hypothetical protein
MKTRSKSNSSGDTSCSTGSRRIRLAPAFSAKARRGLWQLDPSSDWKTQAQRIYDIVLSGLQRST